MARRAAVAARRTRRWVTVVVGAVMVPALGTPAPASGTAVQVGAEHPLAQPFYVPASGRQASVSLAANGTEYFAVWEDNRLGTSDIFGTRLALDGKVLDPSGIVISSAPRDQVDPSVVWGGSEFLVAWQDHRNGADVYGARVGPGGGVLDRGGIAISRAPGPQADPAVAFDGTRFLVTWDDGRSLPTDIYGARVGQGGGVLDSGGIKISGAPSSQVDPDVVWTGSSYFAVWRDSRNGTAPDIYGTRISAQGSVLNPGGIAISAGPGSQLTPAIARLGGTLLVVWDRRTTGDRIVAARVGTNGTVLDPSGFVVATGSTAQTVPAVDTAGSVFLVAWQDRRTTDDVYAARVATSGQVLDPSGFVVASTADPDQEPSVVRGPSGPALVAWQQGQDDANVLGVRIEANGTVDRPAVLFSTAASDQTRPAIAWNGSIYLAAWSDHRLGGIGISYSRLSADGASLDGTGIQLVSGTQPFISPSNPAVAAGVNGTTREFLLVWEDRRSAGPSQIWGARVAANGTVLDPGGFRIFARGTDALMLPAVAWDGTNFLVAWEELKFGAGGVPGVSATRVAPDGTVLDSGGITITNSTSSKFGVAVAGNAGGFLVAWADDRSGNADVFARRVSPQGSALGTGPTVVAQASGGQTWPAAATQGSAFLVAWKSVDQVNNVHKVFARRISATGAVLDPGITVFPYAGTPAATWNGTTYLVAAGTSNGVLGQRIGSTGVKQDGNGFPISPQGDEAMAARGTGARVAVGYVRPAPERPYGSDLRGFVRFIDPT